jgi:hypothetical protein
MALSNYTSLNTLADWDSTGSAVYAAAAGGSFTMNTASGLVKNIDTSNSNAVAFSLVPYNIANSQGLTITLWSGSTVQAIFMLRSTTGLTHTSHSDYEITAPTQVGYTVPTVVNDVVLEATTKLYTDKFIWSLSDARNAEFNTAGAGASQSAFGIHALGRVWVAIEQEYIQFNFGTYGELKTKPVKLPGIIDKFEINILGSGDSTQTVLTSDVRYYENVSCGKVTAPNTITDYSHTRYYRNITTLGDEHQYFVEKCPIGEDGQYFHILHSINTEEKNVIVAYSDRDIRPAGVTI